MKTVCGSLPGRLKTKRRRKRQRIDDEKPVRKVLKKEGRKEALTALVGELADASFDAAALEHAIRTAEKKAGLAEGKLNQPIRVAITGSGTGAGIYETMEILGRERTTARLSHAIDSLCG